MKGIKLSTLALLLSLTLFVAGCGAPITATTPTDTTVIVEVASDFGTCANLAVESIEGSNLYFAYNQYDISDEYRALLRQKAEFLIKYPTIRVRIEGNCDERGTQEYNLALGERRARAAYEYLVRLGVNPNQLEVISYGKERPVATGDNEKSWALNRHDAFRVIAQ